MLDKEGLWRTALESAALEEENKEELLSEGINEELLQNEKIKELFMKFREAMEKPTSTLPTGFGSQVKSWEEMVSDEVQDMKDSKTIFEDDLQEMYLEVCRRGNGPPCRDGPSVCEVV